MPSKPEQEFGSQVARRRGGSGAGIEDHVPGQHEAAASPGVQVHIVFASYAHSQLSPSHVEVHTWLEPSEQLSTVDDAASPSIPAEEQDRVIPEGEGIDSQPAGGGF